MSRARHQRVVGRFLVAPSFARCSGPRCRATLAGLRAWAIKRIDRRECEFICAPCMQTGDFSTTGPAS